jgi:hypothetical protein
MSTVEQDNLSMEVVALHRSNTFSLLSGAHFMECSVVSILRW